MEVCKFFLQGICKFGTNCKFSHGNPSRSTGTSILRQRNPTSTGPTVDVNTLVKAVQTDMINAEKGGLWQFSAYAPFKEKPCFPGFEDKSCEEVRLGFYEAKLAGTLNEYKRQLQIAQQQVSIKIRALQNPNEEAVNTLQTIYNTPVAHQGTTFAQFATHNPVGMASTAGHNTPFGSAPTSNSPFAQSGAGFMQSTPSSMNIFGGAGAPTANGVRSFGPMFGDPSAAAANSAPQETSIFAAAARNYPGQPQQTGSIFGGSTADVGSVAQNPPVGIFGGGGASTTNIFASCAVTAAPSTTNIFRPNLPVPPSNTNLFQPNVPNQQQVATTLYSALPDSQNPQFVELGPMDPKHVPSNSSSSHSNLSVSSRGNDLYNLAEDLNEMDIICFQMDDFHIGNVPTQAPTVEMCTNKRLNS